MVEGDRINTMDISINQRLKSNLTSQDMENMQLPIAVLGILIKDEKKAKLFLEIVQCNN